MKFLVLLLFSLPAQTPVPVWNLKPTGFIEHNLCLKPCALKADMVTGYHWEAT
jgi:hypothetical protein